MENFYLSQKKGVNKNKCCTSKIGGAQYGKQAHEWTLERK